MKPWAEGRASAPGQDWVVYCLAGLLTAGLVQLHEVLGFTRAGQPAAILFLLPVVVCAFWGGLWPGVVATIVNVLVVDYFAMPPLYSLVPDREVDQARLLTLVGLGVVLSAAFEMIHRARRQARMREQLYAVTLASIGDGVLTTTMEGRVAFLNAEAENLTGWSRAEAEGREWGEVFQLEAEFEGAVVEGAKLQTRDGRRAVVDAHVAPIRGEGGATLGTVVVFRDRTAALEAEGALAASQVRMTSLFENMLSGYAHCRMLFEEGKAKDYVHLEVNRAFERLTGLKNAAGRWVTEMIPGIREANPELFERYGRVAAGGAPEQMETYVPGLKTWFAISVYSTEPEHFVVVFDDITQRKAAEAELKRTTERLHLALESARAGAWEWELETGKNYWSPELWALYGLAADSCEPSYASWRSTIVEEDRAAVEAAVLGAAETGEVLRAEWRVKLEGGEERWLATRGEPHVDAAGRVERYLGIVYDVTEAKALEAALRDSEERFRLFMDNTPTLAWMKDAEGRYVYTNRRFRERLGVKPDEAGLTDAELYPESQVEEIRRNDLLVLATREGVTSEQELPAGDGGADHYLKLKFPMVDSGGRVYVAGVAVDVSEARRAQLALEELNAELERRVAARTAELQATNKELEAFSYSVSHDLRAPLRAVNGFARCLEEEAGPRLSEGERDYLTRILNAGARMGQLIDDLLTLARITRAECTQQNVDVTGLAGEVVTELRRREPGRVVEVRVEPGIRMDGDVRLLRIVLENLLGNAYKFTAKRQEAVVELGARRDAEEVVCWVKDNGAGFDMQYAGKLFGAFQRLHSAREYAGTGIGLATVQRIVNRHGGRVWAEAAVEEGATFYFALPAGREEE